MFEQWEYINLLAGAGKFQVKGGLFARDVNGNRLGLHMYHGNDKAALSGTVQGIAKFSPNSDNIEKFEFTGEIGQNGSDVWVDLPKECYYYPGPMTVAIRLVDGDSRTVLATFSGHVNDITDGTPTVPPQSLPDNLEDFISELEGMKTTVETAAAKATAVVDDMNELKSANNNLELLAGEYVGALNISSRYTYLDLPGTIASGDKIVFQVESFTGTAADVEEVYIMDGSTRINGLNALSLTNEEFRTANGSASAPRLIVRMASKPSTVLSIKIKYYIIGAGSYAELTEIKSPHTVSFAVTVGNVLSVANNPIYAETGDVIAVKIENPSLIASLQVGYRNASNVAVNNVLCINANAYNIGYFKVEDTFLQNSLILYVAAKNIKASGTIAITYWNCTKSNSFIPRRKYSSFSVLGDSYSAYIGYVDPSTNRCWYPPTNSSAQGYGDDNGITSPFRMWWHLFANNTQTAVQYVAAYSGSTISYDSYGDGSADGKSNSFITRMDDIGKPDLCIIFGGTNDDWAGASIGDYKYSGWVESDLSYFAPALAYLLDKLLNKHAGMDIAFIENDMLTADYKTAIDTVCAHYNVPVIQPENVEKVHNHPNINGMITIANAVAQWAESIKLPYYTNN